MIVRFNLTRLQIIRCQTAFSKLIASCVLLTRYAAPQLLHCVGHSPTGCQLPSSSGVQPLSSYLQVCVHLLIMWLRFDMHGETGPVTLKHVQFTAQVETYLHLHLSLTFNQHLVGKEIHLDIICTLVIDRQCMLPIGYRDN